MAGKTKKRTEEEYKKLIHRLNRIEGQVRGIRRMIEQEAYCTDILVQSSAVTAAVGAFNREVRSAQIQSCVAGETRQGNDEGIDELMETLRKMMK